jgi:Fe-S-cluster containining protein
MVERFCMRRGVEHDRQRDFFEVCGHCTHETSCCYGTRPPITSERRRIIEAYLEKEKISIADAFVRTDYVFPRENAKGYCVFFNGETSRCLIHPVKPETCVAGPITFDINKQTGKVEWFIKMERICQLAGIVFNDKQLLQKHLESAKIEITGLLDGLGPEELEAILMKDEPETFKIGVDLIRKRDEA